SPPFEHNNGSVGVREAHRRDRAAIAGPDDDMVGAKYFRAGFLFLQQFIYRLGQSVHSSTFYLKQLI
ncbi:MAG: hypothetical protein WD994_05445, partial [Pseudomonadales bacterium]